VENLLDGDQTAGLLRVSGPRIVPLKQGIEHQSGPRGHGFRLYGVRG
jgi:hypothetical protein